MSDRADELGAAVRASVAGVGAPPGLRAAVARERLRSAPAPRRARPGRRLAAGAAFAVAVAAIAVVIVGLGDRAPGPSVADAAQAALLAPTAPAPAVAPDGEHLRLAVGGVAFPRYEGAHGWRAVGVRTDRLRGRTARTVVYGRGAERAGYTIVAGAPLRVPAGARVVRYDGLDVAVVDRGGYRYITWRRGGHTCVLATQGSGLRALLSLTEDGAPA